MSSSYNKNISQPATDAKARISIFKTSPYKLAVIEDIILNEEHPKYDETTGINVGMALVRFIPDDRRVAKQKLNWVSPLDTSVIEYPLKNETVLIFHSISGLFYTRRLGVTNKITDSRWPGISAKYSPSPDIGKTTQNLVLAAQGGAPMPERTEEDLEMTQNEFVENQLVRRLRPTEGDLIIQGRFGNSIRFGSSLLSNPVTLAPSANLLLTAGQAIVRQTSTPADGAFSLVFEDINKDRSSIWMVSDEQIILDPATKNSVAHLRSSELADSNLYTGAQIFINSDRLILNSKINEISLFSNSEINFSAVQSITIDSANSVMITAEKDITLTTPQDVVLSGRTISIISPNDISMGTSTGNYTIDGRKIFIGSGGDESQPMVLGGELTNWLQTLVSALALLSVTFIPSPTGAASAAQLARYLTELKVNLGVPGIPQSAVFNSTSNFTSKTN